MRVNFKHKTGTNTAMVEIQQLEGKLKTPEQDLDSKDEVVTAFDSKLETQDKDLDNQGKELPQFEGKLQTPGRDLDSEGKVSTDRG